MELYGTRRMGTFYISEPMLRHWPDMVRGLLAQCVVVRCEYLFVNRSLYYTAWSEEFAEVSPLERAPEYGVSVHVSEQRMWFVPKGQETLEYNPREIVPGQLGLTSII